MKRYTRESIEIGTWLSGKNGKNYLKKISLFLYSAWKKFQGQSQSENTAQDLGLFLFNEIGIPKEIIRSAVKRLSADVRKELKLQEGIGEWLGNLRASLTSVPEEDKPVFAMITATVAEIRRTGNLPVWNSKKRKLELKNQRNISAEDFGTMDTENIFNTNSTSRSSSSPTGVNSGAHAAQMIKTILSQISAEDRRKIINSLRNNTVGRQT